MPYRKKARKSKVSTKPKTKKKGTTGTRKKTKKTLPKGRSSTPKRVTRKMKLASTGPKFVKVLNKVFKESVSHTEELIPLVLQAARSVGFKGSLGTGISVLALLANTEIGKAAVRLLISKTKEITSKGRFVEFVREAFGDASDFSDVNAEMMELSRNYDLLLSDETSRASKRFRGVGLRRDGGAKKRYKYDNGMDVTF